MSGFAGAAHAKEALERLQSRMAGMRKTAEKGIEQVTAVVEVNGGLAGWGFVNEAYGKPPKDDVVGMREHAVMGMPTDLVVGLGLLGATMFGGFGKYEQHGLNLSLASTGAFSYRLGAEAGRRHEANAGKPATKTAGQMTAGHRMGPNGGRMHHVDYQEAR